MKTLLSILCSLVLAGCAGVVMKEPLPETKLSEEERSSLEGTWILEDEVVYYISFSSNKISTLAWVDDEAPDLCLEKMRIRFTKNKDSFYFSVPTEPGETNEYFFAEFKVEEDRAVVWVPDFDLFEQLIEEGTIPGTNSSDTIRLDSPPNDILKLITTNASAFNYKEPILLRKLK